MPKIMVSFIKLALKIKIMLYNCSNDLQQPQLQVVISSKRNHFSKLYQKLYSTHIFN